ncbi:unnamed protein product [Rotaria magnacalcarata]|nr:unnamed protein product [Rotaria magnacalcarata]
MIRTIYVDINNISDENDDEASDFDDESNDDGNFHDESQSDNEAAGEDDWVNDDDDDEITDNFVEGVNTEEMILYDFQHKVREVIDFVRAIVTTTNRTSLLSTLIKKKTIIYEQNSQQT